MKFLTIILHVIFCASVSFAQDGDSIGQRVAIPLLKEDVKVNTLSKSEVLLSLEKGDSIVFDFKVAKGLKIQSVAMYDPNGKLLKQYDKPNRVLGDWVDISMKGNHLMVFSNKGFFPRSVALAITQYPAPPIYVDSVYWDTVQVVEKVVETTYDTVYKMLLDTTFTLDAQLNVEGSYISAFKLPIPLEISFYWATWVGVEQTALDAYEEMAAKLSPYQDSLGITPLIAYGMGLEDDLPLGKESDLVKIQYTDKKNSQLFLKHMDYSGNNAKGKSGNLPLLSRSKVLDFAESIPLFLCLENKDGVSPTTVHVKVAGFQINEHQKEKETPTNKLIKRVKKVKG